MSLDFFFSKTKAFFYFVSNVIYFEKKL